MILERAIRLFLSEYIPTTQVSYRQPLQQMAGWIGAQKDVAQVRVSDLQEYMAHCKETKGWKPATVGKHIKTLKVFFNWAVKSQYIEKSPAAVLKNVKLAKRKDRAKAMTDHELATLLEMKADAPRDYALLLWLADTGARAGGTAGLRWRDVNLDTMTAIITEKGNKERRVPFGERCAKALLYWYRHRPESAGEYVFSRSARKMDPHTISQMLRRACKDAGLRTLSSHSLRHRKCHQLSDAGVSPTIAAVLTGHENPQVLIDSYYPHDYETADREGRKLTVDHTIYAPTKVVKMPKSG